MASSNFPFLEGNSINRPFMFNGEGYHYWKTRMQILIEAIDLNIWDAIEVGPFIPTKVVGNVIIEKPREEWNDDERRKVQYNLKAKNIITSALSMDETVFVCTFTVVVGHIHSGLICQCQLRRSLPHY